VQSPNPNSDPTLTQFLLYPYPQPQPQPKLGLQAEAIMAAEKAVTDLRKELRREQARARQYGSEPDDAERSKALSLQAAERRLECASLYLNGVEQANADTVAAAAAALLQLETERDNVALDTFKDSVHEYCSDWYTLKECTFKERSQVICCELAVGLAASL
jgi:hypothetical protein